MSVQDVRTNWSTYGSVAKLMFTSINDPESMANATPVIGPFPADRPTRWGIWLNAFAGLGALEDAVRVTDAALRQENDFIVATNRIAAAVRLPAPTATQIQDLVAQLEVVNDRIKQDQRFAAALAVGVALAGRVETQLKA